MTVFFAPIDEENTLLYVRFWQHLATWPVIGKVMCELANLFNRIIVRQDKRVVITQQPLKSALRMGEKLVLGDSPIIAYRRRRAALKAATSNPEEALSS